MSKRKESVDVGSTDEPFPKRIVDNSSNNIDTITTTPGLVPVVRRTVHIRRNANGTQSKHTVHYRIMDNIQKGPTENIVMGEETKQTIKHTVGGTDNTTQINRHIHSKDTSRIHASNPDNNNNHSTNKVDIHGDSGQSNKEVLPREYDYTPYARKRLGRLLNPQREHLDFFFKTADYDVPNANVGPIIHIYGIARCSPNPPADMNAPPLDTADFIQDVKSLPSSLSDPSKIETPIRVNVTGYKPHFFIVKKPEWTEQMVIGLIAELERTMRDKYPWPKAMEDMANLRTSLITGYKYTKMQETTFAGYEGEGTVDMIDISLCSPKIVPILRHILEYPDGFSKLPGGDFRGNGELRKPSAFKLANPNYKSKATLACENCRWNYRDYGIKSHTNGSTTNNKGGAGSRSDIAIYEADVDFVLRFLADMLFTPSSWFRILAGKYKSIPYSENKDNTCELEVTVDYKDLIQLKVSDDPAVDLFLPNFKGLSHDGEWFTNGKQFPKKGVDKCLQIGIVVWNHNDPPDTYQSYVFALKGMGGVESFVDGDKDKPIITFCFDTELDLFKGFFKFLHAIDPDVVTGYNVNGFDYPYMVARAIALGFPEFARMGRCKTRTIYMPAPQERHGRKKYIAAIPGRISMDMMNRMILEKNWPEYTLNYAAKTLLVNKEGKPMTKVEFNVELIALFQETEAGRSIMRTYVQRDAEIPMKLVKLGYIGSYIMTSRISCIPWQSCLDREQGAKIEGRLRQEANGRSWKGAKEDFVPTLKRTMPTKRKFDGNEHDTTPSSAPQQKAGKKAKFKGAVVITPLTGFYDNPVVTLDAASMYPSIIMAFNLCYTTFVSDETIQRKNLVEGKDYKRRPDYDFNDPKLPEIYNPLNPCFMIPIYAKVINPVTGLEEEVIVSRGGMLPRIEYELGLERALKRGDKGLLRVAAEIDVLQEQIKQFLNVKVYDIGCGLLPKKAAKVAAVKLELVNLKNDDQLSPEKKLEAEKKLQTTLTELREAIIKKAFTLDISNASNDKVLTKEYNQLKTSLASKKIEHKLLDDSQNAIKAWMNSIYGITGDTTSKFYMAAIATTITATGRWMTNRVKIEVEKKYTRANGYPFDATVIYGDTDSVMVHLRYFGKCIPEAFSYGYIILKFVNSLFLHLKPAKFALDKIYMMWTLITAKNYYGLKYMCSDEGKDKPSIDVKGMRHKKRGNTAFFVRVMTKCCEMIAKSADLEGALAYAHQEIEKLRKRQVHPADFEKRAKLSKDVLLYGVDEDADNNNNNDTKKRNAKRAYLAVHQQPSVDEGDDNDEASIKKQKRKISLSAGVLLARDTMIKDGVFNLISLVNSIPSSGMNDAIQVPTPFYALQPNPVRQYRGDDVDSLCTYINIYQKRPASPAEFHTLLSSIRQNYQCSIESQFIKQELVRTPPPQSNSTSSSFTSNADNNSTPGLDSPRVYEDRKTVFGSIGLDIKELLVKSKEPYPYYLFDSPSSNNSIHEEQQRDSNNKRRRGVSSISDGYNVEGKAPVFTLHLTMTQGVNNSSVQYTTGDYVPFSVIQTDLKNPKVSDGAIDSYEAMINDVPLNINYYMEDLLGGLYKVFSGIMGYGRKPGTPEHKLLEEKVDPLTGKLKYVLSRSQEKEITKKLFGVETTKKAHVFVPVLETSAMFPYMERKAICLHCRTRIASGDNKIDLGNMTTRDEDNNNSSKEDTSNMKYLIKLADNICTKCVPDLEKDLQTLIDKYTEERKTLDKEKDDCIKKCISCLGGGEGARELVDLCVARSCSVYQAKMDNTKKCTKVSDQINILTPPTPLSIYYYNNNNNNNVTSMDTLAW